VKFLEGPILMNRVKLFSPDFTPGRVLVIAKAIVDILVLGVQRPSKKTFQFARMILKVKPRFTMVKNKNLINLYHLVQEADRLHLPGDIVECGVWNGGSAAFMAVADAEGPNPRLRTLWLFDSFEGLPRPDERDGEEERKAYFAEWNKGDMEKVKQVFKKMGLGLEKVKIVPGWFEQTLTATPMGPIALLHIDADWYSSVKTALEAFYDKVVPGGFVILDDYGYWKGCTQALQDFLSEHESAQVRIERMGREGGYFQKPVADPMKRSGNPMKGMGHR
jgi:O-methyltransferase